ncbi:MAG: universal stress protein [Dehalococcoidia bacterium]|nr:universal stress protein [Dehalococcoidia bacterium]
MTTRILVPLEGTQVSDGAISAVEKLARAGDVEVLLLCVWGPQGSQMGQDPVQRARILDMMRCVEANLRQYLAKQEKRLADQGIPTRSTFLVGYPSEGIFTVARQQKADLVLMSTAEPSGPMCRGKSTPWCQTVCNYVEAVRAG